MEHELGGMFDVAHGAGLAAIWGSWARYVYHAAPERFEKFAVNVLGILPCRDRVETILRGICAMEDFYRELHMPTSLSMLGITPSEAQIIQMSESCARATGGTNGRIVPLTAQDMAAIYRMAR